MAVCLAWPATAQTTHTWIASDQKNAMVDANAQKGPRLPQTTAKGNLNWFIRANWSSRTVPLPGDNAVFSTLADGLTINVDGFASVAGLGLGAANLTLTLASGLTAVTTVVEADTTLDGGIFTTTNLHLNPGATLTRANIGTIFGTLSGAGSLIGNVSIGGGGAHSPGGSMSDSFGLSTPDAATQTIAGTLNYQSESIFEWNLTNLGTSRGTSYDAVNASTLTGTGAVFRIVLNGVSSSDLSSGGNRVWTDIFKTSEEGSNIENWTSTFSSIQVVNYSGPGVFTMEGNDLQFSAVPEPSSALAGLLIAAGLVRRSRRSILSS